jgi:TatD DNase family protein
VQRVVTIGTDVASSLRAVEVAEGHPAVWATVGVDPNDLEGFDASGLGQLEELAASERVVAIGEIGLDYHWNRSPRDVQIGAFRDQLALAADRGLPVVVHSRDAGDDTYAILSDWVERLPTPVAVDGRPAGVMHCFSGDLALARSYVDLGFLVSLAGNVTYPNATRLHEVARDVPAIGLVLETDAPYLAPQALRGARNEPAHVRLVAEHVGMLRQTALEHIARLTSDNASRLFGWSAW